MLHRSKINPQILAFCNITGAFRVCDVLTEIRVRQEQYFQEASGRAVDFVDDVEAMPAVLAQGEEKRKKPPRTSTQKEKRVFHRSGRIPRSSKGEGEKEKKRQMVMLEKRVCVFL